MGIENSNNNNDSDNIGTVCVTESTVYRVPCSESKGLLISSDGYKETSVYSAMFDKPYCMLTKPYIMTISDGRKTYEYGCYGPHPDDSRFKPVVVDGGIKIRDCAMIIAADRADGMIHYRDMTKAEKEAVMNRMCIRVTRKVTKMNGATMSGYERTVCIDGVNLVAHEPKIVSKETPCSIE